MLRLTNPGRAALWTGVASWAIGIGFLLLSWLTVALLYQDGVTSDPKPEGFLLLVFPVLASLAVPTAFGALVLGVLGLAKGRSRGAAVVAILMALPVLLVAGLGIFALSMGGV